MPNGFDKLTEGIGNAIQTVPELYHDAFQPAVQESGKTLALIPRTINAALSPLRQWITLKEYNVAETEKLLAQKLKNIDPEKIVTPEPYVAVPALQAISYSMSNDELRDLYAELLSKAMNDDTKAFVHPSFVEIIKQMSPLDAKIIRTFKDRPHQFIADFVGKFKNGYALITECVYCDFLEYDVEIRAASLFSLQRSGLVTITYNQNDCDQFFENFKSIPDYTAFLNELAKSFPNVPSHIKKGRCTLTPLGKIFINVCIS